MFNLDSIRPELPGDHSSIAELNCAAFGQTEEAVLVTALREGGYIRLSLVAEFQGSIVGHILFSRLPIITFAGEVEALSLAPMAVLPPYQRRGIGTRLIEEGLRQCKHAGHKIIVVLGHPDYYPKFGFSAKLAEPLTSPFSGGSSWMALEVAPGALAGVSGRVEYPPPFTAFST